VVAVVVDQVVVVAQVDCYLEQLHLTLELHTQLQSVRVVQVRHLYRHKAL
jgi:hypothetical protein